MIDLFSYVGDGHDFYSDIQSGKHPKHTEIKRLLNSLFDSNKEYLDYDFHLKFPKEFERRLWELIFCDYLRVNSEIKLLPRTNYVRKDQSSPDFCFIYNEIRYFIEAVTISAGMSEELSISYKNALGTAHLSPRIQYVRRFTSAIKDKTEKYKSHYKSIIKEDDGYIIAVSSGLIDAWIHPLDPMLEFCCLYGFSERLYNAKLKMFYHNPQLIIKSKNGSEIPTDYFCNTIHSYLSGVIFSNRMSVCFNQLSNVHNELLGVPSPSEEFILAHNPYAIIKIPQGIMPVREEVNELLIKSLFAKTN
jgi:hypothetical protein